MKSDLHVTLWHRNSNSQKDLLRLRNMVGQHVHFKVTHLDHSPQISAARVELMDKRLLHLDGYLHITVLVGEGIAAADSKHLPMRVQNPEDTATAIHLDEELHLEGTLKMIESST